MFPYVLQNSIHKLNSGCFGHLKLLKKQKYNVLGYEYHFIFRCPMYTVTRHIYLQAYIDNMDNANSLPLIDLFQPTNHTVNRNSSMFI